MATHNDGVKPEAKKKIIGLLSALFSDANIYLFGSRARGKFSEGADIDLALDVGHELAWHDIGEARRILENSSIIYNVDVLDVNAASLSESFKKHILNEMIEWNA